MPAAVAIPAAVSAGTSIFGSIMGSRAAKGAAQTQAAAAQAQAAEFKKMLEQYNPQIGAAAERAATGVLGATDTGINRVLGAADTGASQMRSDTLAANQMLNPYIEAGAESLQSLRDFMGGEGNRTFTAADMEAYDPGYQFRLDQAQQAMQKSAAARGGVMGGGFAKALAEHQQNLASSEFGAAEARFRAQQQDRFGRLMGLSTLGGQYAGAAGQNLINAGVYGGNLGMTGAQSAANLGMTGNQYAGNAWQQAANQQAQNALYSQRSIADLMTGGANAQAAGQVGSANAWMQGLGQISNAANRVGDYYQDKDMYERYGNQGGYGGWTPTGSPNGYNVGGTYIPGLPDPGVLPPPDVRSYPMSSYQNPALISRYAPRLRYGGNP